MVSETQLVYMAIQIIYIILGYTNNIHNFRNCIFLWTLFSEFIYTQISQEK